MANVANRGKGYHLRVTDRAIARVEALAAIETKRRHQRPGMIDSPAVTPHAIAHAAFNLGLDQLELLSQKLEEADAPSRASVVGETGRRDGADSAIPVHTHDVRDPRPTIRAAGRR